METFEQLLEATLLELGIMDRVRAAGSNVAHAVDTAAANKKDRFLSKFGSMAAKGRLNLRDMEQQLFNDFKVFCAEQKIATHNATVEDFLEFLKYKVGFNFPDNVFDKLAYGAVAQGEAENKDDIRALYDQIARGIQDGSDISQPLDQMAQFAAKGDADSVAARKALWGLARENPSQVGKFSKHMKWVGKPIGSNFRKLVSSIASLVLKVSNSKGGAEKGADGKAGGKAGRPQHNVDPQTLKVPNLPIFDAQELADKGTDYEPLITQLGEYGMGQGDLTKWLNQSARWTPEEAKQGSKEIDKRFKLNQTINICRILLQCYRPRANYPKLPLFLDSFKGNPQFTAELKTLIGQALREPDGNGEDQIVYNATKLNQLIADEITREDAAANMLTVLLHELRKARIL